MSSVGVTDRYPPTPPEVRRLPDREGAGELEGSSKPFVADAWGRSVEEFFAYPLQALPEKPTAEVGQ